jgi:CHAD domain-containing protein
MKPDELNPALLRAPVERGVRFVALDLIEAAIEASEDLSRFADRLSTGEADAAEALHDFRVSVRRLRSWLRAFKPWFADDVSRKRRRQLARIAEETRVSRDSSVHLDWLQQQKPHLSSDEVAGHAYLTGRMEERRREGSDDALTAAENFPSLGKKLGRKLRFYRAAVKDDDSGDTFAAVYGQTLLRQSEELRSLLGGIRDFTSVEQAHRARIAAKNLRYLMAPARELANDGKELVDVLASLQDCLGDLHDVHVFAEELVSAGSESAAVGFLSLARRLHDRGAKAFAELERGWLNDAGAPFFDRVREFALRISRIGDTRTADAKVATASRRTIVFDREVTSDSEQTNGHPANGDETAPTPRANGDGVRRVVSEVVPPPL